MSWSLNKWVFGSIKMNFKFRNQVSGNKYMKKLGSFLQFLCSLPKLCSLNYQKSFWQFCAELSKRSKSIKEIYIYASESSRNALLGNCIFYYILRLSVSKILGFEIEEFC